jgi:hypothetical protein
VVSDEYFGSLHFKEGFMKQILSKIYIISAVLLLGSISQASSDLDRLNLRAVESLYLNSIAVDPNQLQHRTVRSGRCYLDRTPEQIRPAIYTFKRESGHNKIAITWGPTFDAPNEYDKLNFDQAEARGRAYSIYQLDQASNALMFHPDGMTSRLRWDKRWIFEQLTNRESGQLVAYCVYGAARR